MKKGGVVPQKASPAKRRRSESNAVQEPEPMSNPSGLTQWRKASGPPSLGGASKNWELPDVKSDDLNFVSSWDAANAAAEAAATQKLKERQQQHNNMSMFPTKPSVRPSPSGAQHHYVQGGYGGGISVVTASTVSTSKASISAATTVTNSTAGSSGSFGYQPAPAVPPAMQTQQPITTFGAPSQTAISTQPLPKTADVLTAPKSALYQFYGKKPRRKQLSNDDYLVWNNGGRPHELKFTAIFHCPLTGECFPSGRHGDPRFYVVEKMINHRGQEVEVVWYTKKSLAERGAACKVLDCLKYREALLEGQDATHVVRLGADAPYTRAQAPDLPPVPPMIGQKIEELNQRMAGFVQGSAVPQS